MARTRAPASYDTGAPSRTRTTVRPPLRQQDRRGAAHSGAASGRSTPPGYLQQPTDDVEKLHCTLACNDPSVPAPSSVTFWPRDAVCAVPYSQSSPEPPPASSLHCFSGGCDESIAQKDVTALFSTSFSPARSPAACAL